MRIYLVGGAVRDKLLHLPVKERDFVVVGASPPALLAQGFKPVGKDFPVFLHPKTHEAHALARTERKVHAGYHGFRFYTAPDVTLEADLKRRDLTINAMAEDEKGQIIDPFGGQKDLQNGVIRHISPAFAEDPVRILRAARFMATFPWFTLHPDTLSLMQQMVQNKEVHALVKERVFQECTRALAERAPERFFHTLSQCGALPVIFPEWVQCPRGLSALQTAARRRLDTPVRFAALCHPLTVAQLQGMLTRFRVPRTYATLAKHVVRYHSYFCTAQTIEARRCLAILEALDGFRRPQHLYAYIQTCSAIFKDAKQHACAWEQRYLAAKTVSIADIIKNSPPSGEAIRAILHKRRLEAIYTQSTK